MLTVPHIMITKQAINAMYRYSKKQQGTETGGMILGHKVCRDAQRLFVIEKATGPGSQATFSPHSFQPDIEYYRKTRKRYSYMSYLGEWHKHPPQQNDYSQYDIEQAQKILREESIEEMICPISYQVSRGKKKRFAITFFYINRYLNQFIPLSYSIVNSVPLEKHRLVVIEKKVLKSFLKSKKNTQFFDVDFYEKEGVTHLFSEVYDGSSQVHLISVKKTREINLPVGLNITVSQTKDNEINAKAFYVGKSKNPKEIPVQIISPQHDIQSRNKGILETSILRNKHVAIIGVGSVGSVAALELIRAGIGKVTLVDSENVEIENICRHACDLSDIGIAKVTAVEKRIHRIMPSAKVYSHKVDFNNDPDHSLNICCKADVIFVATDTENSRRLANWIAHDLKLPVIFAGILERAIGGRVWRVIPGKTACYECHSHLTQIQTKNKVPYSELESLKDLTVQPGLGNDIAFVTHLAVRYITDTLIEPQLKYLSQIPYNTVFWFNRSREDWNSKDLTIYHVNDLPVNDNCNFCANKTKE